MLFCRAALPLSSRTLNFTAAVVRRHLKATGSRRRKPNPGQESGRYVNEVVELPAGRAPKLRQAVALPGSVRDRKTMPNVA